MRQVEIEEWALRVCAHVREGRPFEDARVELKAEWPNDPHRTARQMAGHANAAGGEVLLWLIGVDEGSQTVGITDTHDFADWWGPIAACFDEAAPTVTAVVVHLGQEIVVALLIETAGAPFVVKNPDFGSPGVRVSLEVPWREMATTRTARRSDLLRVLVPAERLPVVQVRRAKVRAFRGGEADSVEYEGSRIAEQLFVKLDCYIEVPMGAGLVLPDHQCDGSIVIGSERIDLDEVLPGAYVSMAIEHPRKRNMREPREPVRTVQQGLDQLIVDGPGPMEVQASAYSRPVELPADIQDSGAGISLRLRFVGLDRPVEIDIDQIPWRTGFVDSGEPGAIMADWVVATP